MVGALRGRGHTVAMTGDGVNDVLALKDADIGVAMGAGAPATRSVAQIVLLDNSFATLPHVVAEGRRVIGNIERVSNLFLTKTFYSALLALLVGVMQMPFPFQPIHVTVTGWFTIGIPAFILSLAPNDERARPGFVKRVVRLAIPSGVVVAGVCFTVYLLLHPGADADGRAASQASTATLVALIITALWVLVVVARALPLVEGRAAGRVRARLRRDLCPAARPQPVPARRRQRLDDDDRGRGGPGRGGADRGQLVGPGATDG